jgi:5-oxoprolinase (ATP-hydrolysing)
LDEVADAMEAAGLPRSTRDELAAGFLRIANAQMAKAIRGVSLAKGCDPADYVLVAFGGAAAQHACAVAEDLGIRRILSHPDASLLSAYGIGLADAERHAARGVYREYSPAALESLTAEFAALESETRVALMADGVPATAIGFRRQLDLRYRGVDLPLAIDCPADGDYSASYAAEHRRRFGYVHTDRPLEIVAARVTAFAPATVTLPQSRLVERTKASTDQSPADGIELPTKNAGFRVFERSLLAAGSRIEGPAIVVEPYSTTVIDFGWTAAMLSAGELLIERSGASGNASSGSGAAEAGGLKSVSSEEAAAARSSEQQAQADPGLADLELADLQRPSPIYLEVFNGRFMGIAEQMGITLRNTAISVNVKERLDFSCAVFDRDGDLIVNAPHMPVHLGAMSETVKRLIVDVPEIHAGDVLLVNDPYAGGSHLPDVTVVTPVHDPATGRRVFFTASRAHHAEIGGVTPGSMPPFSRRLSEEGVLLRGFKLVEAGEPRFERLRSLLETSPYPSRAVADNLADVAAQVAANRQGARDLERLVERYGLAVVEAYMGHIKAAAERKVRTALGRFPRGRRAFTDRLDDGSPISVAIDLQGDSATFDFTGTGPVLAGNLNANRAIVTAAVLYVLRCLLDEDVPLNQGVLKPVRIILPECLLNPSPGTTPAESPAVVGGNVETSQRVVDVLLGALELAAASQGTMNNLLFGDGTFGYYETICGGSGATATAAGADAVHTHMTNTRLTDPEVMERRFPVRVREFSIRRGSGGSGQFRGGDGIRRRIEFLRPLTLSLLTERRGPYAPFGLRGGAAGELGRNRLFHADGTVELLPAKVQRPVAAGDMVEIETPGGGGWGEIRG